MTVLFGMVSRRSSRFKWDDEGRRRSDSRPPARPGQRGACGIPSGAVSALCPLLAVELQRSEFTRRLEIFRSAARSAGTGTRRLPRRARRRSPTTTKFVYPPITALLITRSQPFRMKSPGARAAADAGVRPESRCDFWRPRLAVLRPRAADGAGARHRQSRASARALLLASQRPWRYPRLRYVAAPVIGAHRQ